MCQWRTLCSKPSPGLWYITRVQAPSFGGMTPGTMFSCLSTGTESASQRMPQEMCLSSS
ncbi:hypothetical protein RLOC_00015030 [Lonchura striata]|uniref:Uncharacterized protein n=1 Tax=Lonchura striata TaxID=40157 RepID=A0A218V468_9PASE|nr:hypothetical protein RLOC_00015030 [Lonchura striata domestica]